MADHRSKCEAQVRANLKNAQQGTMLCIDPGSTTMGWSMWIAGQLVGSGSIDNNHRVLNVRLKKLGEEMRTRFPNEVDLLVVEYIAPPNKKTVMRSYLRLIKSIGTIFGTVKWKYCIEVHPTVWQEYTDEGWTKGDKKDAEYIGKCVLGICEELSN